MLQEQARTPPAAGRGRGPVTRWLFRLVLGIHAVLAVAQPLLAGSYLSGNLDAIGWHATIGSSLLPLALLQLLAAVLFWWPGRGPWWPALATMALIVAEVTQVSAGYSRTLGLHIPLGVAIVGGSVALFVWSLRWRPAEGHR